MFVKIFISLAAQTLYLNLGLHNCLTEDNLQSMKSDQTSNSCMNWCSYTGNCEAFVVRSNTCYFKNLNDGFPCRGTIIDDTDSILFLKQV